MPIYEYECSQCHHAFEVIQKITDEMITKCDECGENTAYRLVSAPGFQLKGTGWYETDFKNKPKAPPAADTSKETKPATTTTETKAPAVAKSSGDSA